jgi:hypothetical protein
MKLFKIFICLSLFLISGYSNTKGEENLSCTLKSGKKKYRMGEGIVLIVSIKNNTTKPIYFIDYRAYNAPYGSVKPIIIGENGQKVDIIWKTPTVYPPIPPAVNSVEILPNDKWVTESHLLTENLQIILDNGNGISISPGKYRIKVVFNPPTIESVSYVPEGFRPPFGLYELKKLGVKFWSGEIESNVITIDIVDKKSRYEDSEIDQETIENLQKKW